MKNCIISPFSGEQCGGFYYKSYRTLSILLALLSSIFFFGCTKENTTSLKQGSISTQQTSVEYSSTRQDINYARGFSISYRDSVKILSIYTGIQDRNDTIHYALVPKTITVPEAYKDLQIIRTPVERISLFSTTHIGMLSLLDMEDLVVGVSNPKIINSQKIQQRISEGKINEIGNAFSPNLEVILETNPELVMVTALPAVQYARYKTLIDANIPVLLIAEWLEHSPLGRAEWAKIIAALTHQEEKMADVFSKIDSQYKNLVALTDTLTQKPTILPGLSRKDAWFVPGGDSYVARLIRDAGGDYHWKNKKVTGSLQLNMESVFPVALTADYWLNPGTVTSMSDLLAIDERYQEFQPVKNNLVFNNNKQLNAHGGNAYWEKGVVSPHLLLEDLIRILHPDIRSSLFKSKSDYHFYRQIK
jgi:iron complex transport system substrate-binding protein